MSKDIEKDLEVSDEFSSRFGKILHESRQAEDRLTELKIADALQCIKRELSRALKTGQRHFDFSVYLTDKNAKEKFEKTLEKHGIEFTLINQSKQPSSFWSRFFYEYQIKAQEFRQVL